jgi:hypothetical protein
MSIETMKQALDWMEWFAGDDHSIRPKSKAIDIAQALRQAIEQAQKQEPVAMVISETGDESVTMSWWHEPALPVGTQLYTSPPQRQWVGLTNEEEIKLAQDSMGKSRHWLVAQVEAKLKEKNT